MAATSFGTNDPLAVKLFSKKLTVEVLKETWAMRFAGDNSNSLIQIKDETTKSAGDKITYGLRMQGTQAGILGDGTLEGNEEALTTYSDNLVINQLRSAFRNGGRMSQQRVPFDIRDEMLSGERDWWSDRIDTCFFNQISGYAPQTDTRYSGNNAITAVDSGSYATGHYLNKHGAGDDSSITAVDTFAVSLIDAGLERARTFTPAIRPVKVAGKTWYVVIIHPYQLTDLRAAATTAGFFDTYKAAITGGMIEDNPIFDGATGMWNMCIIHADARVTQGYTGTTPITTTRRAVFAGAQACMMAFGRDNGPEKFTWVEQLFDLTASNDNEEGVYQLAA